MKIIDAHLHFSQGHAFKETAFHLSNVDYSAEGYIKETEENDIIHSICMGIKGDPQGQLPDYEAETPMMADLDTTLPASMSLCMGINPLTLNSHAIERMDELIKSNPAIKGIKIYAGYYHVMVHDPIYDPVYDLAEKHSLTVAIHSGDTYSERGLLKYSQPLDVDELAVKRRDMKIIICHMGTPWVYDAAEVAFKNQNVYLDISGLLVGNTAYAERMGSEELLLNRYRGALVFLDSYHKVLYGSDWPLIPMAAYIEFCKKLIPEEFHQRVFHDNARELFGL